MRIAEQLAETAHRDVEAAGFTWRVRAVKSSDIAAHGVAILAAMPPAVQELALEGLAHPENAAALAAETAETLLTPEVAEKWSRYREALCCAALVAARAPGGPFEPVNAVMDRAQANPPNGIVCVGDLPRAAVEVIAAAAAALVKEDAQRFAAFRDGAPATPAAG